MNTFYNLFNGGSPRANLGEVNYRTGGVSPVPVRFDSQSEIKGSTDILNLVSEYNFFNIDESVMDSDVIHIPKLDAGSSIFIYNKSNRYTFSGLTDVIINGQSSGYSKLIEPNTLIQVIYTEENIMVASAFNKDGTITSLEDIPIQVSGNPFCSNAEFIQDSTSTNPFASGIEIVTLGRYVEGEFAGLDPTAYRWILRNNDSSAVTVTWNLPGTGETDTLSLEGNTELVFSTDNAGTMSASVNLSIVATQAADTETVTNILPCGGGGTTNV